MITEGSGELDTSMQDSVICPHCGFDYGADSWELDELGTCEACMTMFIIEKYATISYTTRLVTAIEINE